MATIFLVVATVATALVFGGMAFFSFIMAPLVFQQLEREQAATFMRAAFPLYYRSMGACALVAAAPLAIMDSMEGLLMIAVAVSFFALHNRLLPTLNRHRERRAAGDADADAKFKRLHGFSMAVNLVQLITVLVVLVRLAT